MIFWHCQGALAAWVNVTVVGFIASNVIILYAFKFDLEMALDQLQLTRHLDFHELSKRKSDSNWYFKHPTSPDAVQFAAASIASIHKWPGQNSWNLHIGWRYNMELWNSWIHEFHKFMGSLGIRNWDSMILIELLTPFKSKPMTCFDLSVTWVLG